MLGNIDVAVDCERGNLEAMADTNLGLVDYTDTIGNFVILSQKSQLFALNGISTSTDYSKLAPRINIESFHAVYPLVLRVKPSNIVRSSTPVNEVRPTSW